MTAINKRNNSEFEVQAALHDKKLNKSSQEKEEVKMTDSQATKLDEAIKERMNNG